MTRDAGRVREAQPRTSSDEDGGARAVIELLDARFPVARAFAERGLDVGVLSASELHELAETFWNRLSPVFDEVIERWQNTYGQLTEQEKIERELRRRITSEKAAVAAFHSDWECDGCGYRHYEHCAFEDFHGLLLCDGCAGAARDELRDIQRPLIERLESEQTLEHARDLGFELTRRDDGRLVWVGENDDYDGGNHPYADEQEALDDLVEELTFNR